jgi:hypothetical protein
MAVDRATFDREAMDLLEKVSWFGVDPFKTKRTMELGRYMLPEKFDSVTAYVAALLDAVDARKIEDADHVR